MSSQGDAGQFRTPRHIIDFIVDVLNPTKNDKILDPACGTAGFLVSSYNHILEQHDGINDSGIKEKPLTPDERKKLMQNLQGYDIDPTMVRIAQVNMYLHQFKNPQIFQYDSLTSEERWDDKFDVILANPPFMSPKGGIKPHNKFGLESNRSEVLFVNYIVNHLRPKGRAGIIVPEGIIFQGGKAYKELRKGLVQNGLTAVVSLPGGVFQPYSGVKTSILIFDKEVSQRKAEVAFIKISFDGFDSGAGKKPINKNDLPEAVSAIRNWSEDKKFDSSIISFVSKDTLGEDGEYNLTGDRYKTASDYSNSKWPIVSLSDLEDDGSVEFLRGQNLSKSELNPQGKSSAIHYGELYTSYGPVISHVFSRTDADHKIKSLAGDVLLPATQTADALGMARASALDLEGVIIGGDINIIRTRNSKVLGSYLAFIISNPPMKISLAQMAKGANILHISNSDLRKLSFPLPPLEVQEKIVAELNGYSEIVSGAKKIIDSWKPRIDVQSDWPIVELAECCVFMNGDRSVNYPTHRTKENTGIPFINAGNLQDGEISLESADFLTEEQFAKIGGGKFDIGDILFCLRGSLGKMALNSKLTKGAIASSLIILRVDPSKVEANYLYTFLASDLGQSQISQHQTGAAQPNLAAGNLKKFMVPLPSISVQRELIKEIAYEEGQISSVRTIVSVYETRIAKIVAKLWEK
jgi:type I restriction enzyme M protein